MKFIGVFLFLSFILPSLAWAVTEESPVDIRIFEEFEEFDEPNEEIGSGAIVEDREAERDLEYKLEFIEDELVDEPYPEEVSIAPEFRDR
jgi:hypothetical protein